MRMPERTSTHRGTESECAPYDMPYVPGFSCRADALGHDYRQGGPRREAPEAALCDDFSQGAYRGKRRNTKPSVLIKFPATGIHPIAWLTRDILTSQWQRGAALHGDTDCRGSAAFQASGSRDVVQPCRRIRCRGRWIQPRLCPNPNSLALANVGS